MSTEITPTVGRQVYYYEDDVQQEPWAATVIKVNAPEWQASPHTPISVLAISPEGEQFIIADLPCSPIPAPYPHYRWMAYQKAQAEKAHYRDAGVSQAGVSAEGTSLDCHFIRVCP